MKKIIYIIAITLMTAVTITSCTEEEITPIHNTKGGNGTDPL